MKLKTTLLTLAAVAVASSAFAANYTVRLTGSTAFRSAVHTAIRNSMTDEKYLFSEKTAADGVGKAKYATFVGTIGSDVFTIYCSWEGSSEGVQAAAAGFSRNFIPTNHASFPSTANTGVAVTGESTSTLATEVANATAGFSDVYASSATNDAGNILGYDDAQVTDEIVGVTPFAFIVNESTPGTVTNISGEQFRYLASGGTAAASGFGATGDSTPVHLIGRTPASGTRISVLACTGYGIANAVIQYTVTTDAGEVNATAPVNVGNSGYSSGGDLAKKLKAASSGFYMLGYVGTGDASTALTAGGKLIKFDGVGIDNGSNAIDTTFANVKNGSYGYWSYQHFMMPTSPSADEQAFRDAVIPNLTAANIGTAGIDKTTMDATGVGRTGDGGNIFW